MLLGEPVTPASIPAALAVLACVVLIQRTRSRDEDRREIEYGRSTRLDPRNGGHRQYISKPRPGRGERMIDARVTLPRERWTVPVARHLARVLLDGARVTGDARDDIEIAVSEACGNAVRHARPADRYHLRLHVGGGACMVEVADEGPGFTPPASPASTGASSGRGLAIIRRLADELEVRRRRPGTLVRFRKRLA